MRLMVAAKPRQWNDFKIAAVMLFRYSATRIGQLIYLNSCSNLCCSSQSSLVLIANDLSTVELNLAIQNGLEVDISHVLGATKW